MEKNWIEEIKEFVRKAMNKGFRVRAYNTLMGGNTKDYYEIRIFKGNSVIEFTIKPTKLCLDTSKGTAHFDLTLSKRDLLELDAMILSIEEYNEDMAISDFNNFFGEDNSKPTTIDDLDNEDD
jgi:hypothetical protein